MDWIKESLRFKEGELVDEVLCGHPGLSYNLQVSFSAFEVWNHFIQICLGKTWLKHDLAISCPKYIYFKVVLLVVTLKEAGMDLVELHFVFLFPAMISAGHG